MIRRHPLPAAAWLLAICCICLALTGGVASAEPVESTVEVDAQSWSDRVPSGASGVNAPTWNPHLMDAVTLTRLEEAEIRTLVWQVGPATDLYDWENNSRYPDPEPEGRPWPISLNGPELKPKYTFDEFAERAEEVGAEMVVHVNYGTGTPEEAAAWVAYADEQGYDVKRWVIGEEIFINGYLGTPPYMPDGHEDKSPTAYATNSVEFVEAMKEADPEIEVGVGLAPITSEESPFWGWNETVLEIAAPVVDFVDYHYYRGGETEEELLNAVSTAPGTIAQLRDLVDQYQGEEHEVKLVVGESNSSTSATPLQVSPANGLYLADLGATLLESGVAGFEWYSLHDRAVGDGSTWVSDLGMLSSGECVGSVCQPAAGTPFPTFHGMRLLNTVMKPWSKILEPQSSDSRVAVHAVRRYGHVYLLLINRSPTTSFATTIEAENTKAHCMKVIAYWDQTGADTVSGESLCASEPLELEPYSLTAVRLSSKTPKGC